MSPLLLLLLLLRALSLPRAAAVALHGCASSTSPLGLEDGRLLDSQLSATSSYEPNSVGPSVGRLNSERGGGAWCPKSLVKDQLQEFLEIDLADEHAVSAVLTQGRFANGLGQEFAEHFVIHFWREGLQGFAEYRNSSGSTVMEGNKNTFTVVETKLVPPVLASKVRIFPYSHHARTVCMRIELVGCKQGGGK